MKKHIRIFKSQNKRWLIYIDITGHSKYISEQPSGRQYELSLIMRQSDPKYLQV